MEDTEVENGQESSAKEESFIEAIARQLDDDAIQSDNVSEDVAEQKEQPQGHEKKEVVKQAKTDRQPEAQAEAVIAPADMSAEEKAAFERLPNEMKSYLSRRSYQTRSDYQRQTQQLQKEFGELKQTLEPHREYLAKKGIRETDLVRRSIVWDQAMTKNPKATAREWLDSYGIDPLELVDLEDTTAGKEDYPPDVNTLVQQEIDKRMQQMTQAQRLQQDHHQVQQWMKDKPFFRDPATGEQLESAMAPIVEALYGQYPQAPTTQILERAYNMIITTDERFSGIARGLEARSKADSMRQQANRAQQASRSLSGSVGTAATGKDLSFAEELRLRLDGAL